MGYRKTEEGRLRDGRGLGTGVDYEPWIRISDLNSCGTATSFPDWKHGRMIELLSQAELWWYLKLRWDDSVVDIREQFPLMDIDLTTKIAREMGVRAFQNGRKRMTTDLVVTMENGLTKAFSIKSDRTSVVSNQRTQELLGIEALYWKRKGYDWAILFKEDLNPEEIMNIRDAVECYKAEKVVDSISAIRYLIAHKMIKPDMTRKLDYRSLLEIYGERYGIE